LQTVDDKADGNGAPPSAAATDPPPRSDADTLTRARTLPARRNALSSSALRERIDALVARAGSRDDGTLRTAGGVLPRIRSGLGLGTTFGLPTTATEADATAPVAADAAAPSQSAADEDDGRLSSGSSTPPASPSATGNQSLSTSPAASPRRLQRLRSRIESLSAVRTAPTAAVPAAADATAPSPPTADEEVDGAVSIDSSTAPPSLPFTGDGPLSAGPAASPRRLQRLRSRVEALGTLRSPPAATAPATAAPLPPPIDEDGSGTASIGSSMAPPSPPATGAPSPSAVAAASPRQHLGLRSRIDSLGALRTAWSDRGVARRHGSGVGGGDTSSSDGGGTQPPLRAIASADTASGGHRTAAPSPWRATRSWRAGAAASPTAAAAAAAAASAPVPTPAAPTPSGGGGGRLRRAASAAPKLTVGTGWMTVEAAAAAARAAGTPATLVDDPTYGGTRVASPGAAAAAAAAAEVAAATAAGGGGAADTPRRERVRPPAALASGVDAVGAVTKSVNRGAESVLRGLTDGAAARRRGGGAGGGALRRVLSRRELSNA